MHLLLVVAAYSAVTWAKIVTYNWEIGWVRAAPDGYSRPVIGINGQWPIPVLEADEYDTVVVNVKNSLGNETTSIHWHGLYQQGTNAYDGPTGVAQCPIQPGDSFTYTFQAYPAGTHWYHSHEKGQYPDGLRGKMIIHDRRWERELYIDEQIYLSMSDWYHTEFPFLINDYLSPANTIGDLPSPDSFLFNDTHTAPPEFNFRARKRYLLRIVNTGALACGEFHIEGHTLEVVEADGVQMQPKYADTIVICAGQSYGVVVTGKWFPLGAVNYIAKMKADMLTKDIPPDSARCVIGKAVYSTLGSVLRYVIGSLTPSWTSAGTLDDITLRPRDNQRLLWPVQQEIRLATNQTYYEGIGTRIGIGAQPWTVPKVPSLYTALTTGRLAAQLSTYGPGVDPWILGPGQIIQVYMENPQPWPHPMHLHGHVFQVPARGIGSWDGNEWALPQVPLKRDGIVIPANGYVVLRFVADNPGVWFFHCHIDLHLVGGMASVFIEAPRTLQLQQSVPAAGARLCRAGGKSASGNCAGELGAISASEAMEQCNTIFNSNELEFGALVDPPS